MNVLMWPVQETRASVSYTLRSELPDHLGTFYDGAGLPKAHFIRAHDAQTPETVPERFRMRDERRRSGVFQPVPHPSYAQPHVRAPDENWLQVLATDGSGKVLSREDFRALRKKPSISKSRHRAREPER